jgi:hypothetical protein
MAAAAKRAALPFKVLTMVEHEGRLAVYMASRLLADEPVREISYRVSTAGVDGEHGSLRQFVGCQVDRGGYVYLNGRHTPFDIDSWEWVTIREEIPKPKDGKDHTWTWVGTTYGYRADERNGWRKESFPRCSACWESHRTINGRSVTNTTHHDPSYLPSDCGQCHPGGVCDQRGFCRPGADDW